MIDSFCESTFFRQTQCVSAELSFVRKREENAHNKNREELCGVEGKR